MAKKDSEMFESEYEGRLAEILRNIFPTFGDVILEHQKSFKLRFGKSTVDINTDEQEKTNSPRLDILLTIQGKNQILLELKRPGTSLKEEDFEQAISYARLLIPMPPITVVSNGVENRIFNSFTTEKIDRTIDNHLLFDLLETSCELASSQLKDAFDVVLQRDPEILSKVITGKGKEYFTQLSGNIDQFQFPICQEFLIPREIALKQITQRDTDGSQITCIVGSALSGKTTILYQIFEHATSLGHYAFYLNCEENNYSILQQLANGLSIHSGFPFSKDKVRQWFINATRSEQKSVFYLLIDNFWDGIPDSLQEEIVELIDIFSGGNQRVIITADDRNFQRLTTHRNRIYQTIIGNKSEQVNLDLLSELEFQWMEEILAENFNTSIGDGGMYFSDYRDPRRIRLILSLRSDTQNHLQLPTLPDSSLLEKGFKSPIISNDVRQYFRIFSKKFIEEQIFKFDNKLSPQSVCDYSVSTEGLKSVCKDLYNDFLSSGFFSERYIGEERRTFVKHFEIFSYCCISSIVQELLLKGSPNRDIVKLCKKFVWVLDKTPYSDIIGCVALTELIKPDPKLFMKMVDELVKQRPRMQKVSVGSILQKLDSKGSKEIFTVTSEDEGGCYIINLPEYAILAELCSAIILVPKGNDNDEFGFMKWLVRNVASAPIFLSKPDPFAYDYNYPHTSYDFIHLGTVVSTRDGIFEPIVHALTKIFQRFPAIVLDAFEHAMTGKNFVLAYRVFIATREFIRGSDDLQEQIASKIKSDYQIYMAGVLEEIIDENNIDDFKDLLIDLFADHD